LTIKAAAIGFAQFHPIQEWSRANYNFIAKLLEDEPSLATFSPSDECDEAVTVFACLCHGAVLGKYNAGDISDDEALKAEWYIAAFTSQRGPEICSKYQRWLSTLAP